jgi:trans-aconitate methyltransferase
MSEAAKILPRISVYLQGHTVIDLGCGPTKIVPWAMGVDDYSEQGIKAGADVVCRLEDFNPIQKFDVVFSSHALEHMRAPLGETLSRWFSWVMPGGLLILYLPDERHYVYDHNNPKARNPAHFHLLTPEVVQWHLEQIPGLIIEANEPDLGEDRYSFLVIARKAV